MSTTTQLDLKPYTLKEMAAIYGITPRSFSTYIKKQKIQILVGDKIGKYCTVHQVRTIIEKLGLPGTIGE